MLRRQFGAGSIAVSALGLGCSRIGSFSNSVPIKDIRATLERALELGVTLLDTADVYGQGDSEREIGRLLKGRRDKGFVVTKVGKRFSLKMRMMLPFKPFLRPLMRQKGGAITAQRESNISYDYSPAYIIKAVDSSLRRLGTERIDGLLLHSPPAAELRRGGIEEVLFSLKQAGKLAHFGISCDDSQALEAALEISGIELLELPIDLIEQARQTGLLRTITSRRIGILAREVIRLRPDLAPGAAIAAAIELPEVTSVIVGTSRREHLEAAVNIASHYSAPTIDAMA